MPEYATRQDVQEVRTDLRAHTEDDRAFQERMFNYLGKRFDKIDMLWDKMNQTMGEERGKSRFETEVEVKKTKGFSFAGWAVNAVLNLALVVATIKMLK